MVLIAWSASPAIASPALRNAWSVVPDPTPGTSEAIGSTSDGCLAGGRALPLDGPGYEVIRLSRHRFFGHRATVDFIEALGRRARSIGLPVFYVGDMAQPRGGPLPYGHASHQTGLDVDIWFTAHTRAHLPAVEREAPELPSMVLPGGRINERLFGAAQVSLLRLAAADPLVDRIFVNPAIKLALCRGFAGAALKGRAWLRKLRPWWGHDDHFHVRLKCPANSPECLPQQPVPDGDGCDAALADWAIHQAPPGPTRKPAVPRVMPAACQRIRTE